MKRMLTVVVSTLILVTISAAQQCPPGYPITVTSFSISPSTITGDGHEVASATITSAPTENFNVPVCITGAIPSYACVPPSVPQVGSFACGCAAPAGMNTVYMEFWGNASVTTTDTMNAAVVYPTNPPGCNDPGQSASLTLQAPPTSDPPPTRSMSLPRLRLCRSSHQPHQRGHLDSADGLFDSRARRRHYAHAHMEQLVAELQSS